MSNANVICSMPGCQTSAGCRCAERTTSRIDPLATAVLEAAVKWREAEAATVSMDDYDVACDALYRAIDAYIAGKEKG